MRSSWVALPRIHFWGLLQVIQRRVGESDLRALLAQIVPADPSGEGRGALTSQHLANLCLGVLGHSLADKIVLLAVMPRCCLNCSGLCRFERRFFAELVVSRIAVKVPTIGETVIFGHFDDEQVMTTFWPSSELPC